MCCLTVQSIAATVSFICRRNENDTKATPARGAIIHTSQQSFDCSDEVLSATAGVIRPVVFFVLSVAVVCVYHENLTQFIYSLLVFCAVGLAPL